MNKQQFTFLVFVTMVFGFFGGVVSDQLTRPRSVFAEEITVGGDPDKVAYERQYLLFRDGSSTFSGTVKAEGDLIKLNPNGDLTCKRLKLLPSTIGDMAEGYLILLNPDPEEITLGLRLNGTDRYSRLIPEAEAESGRMYDIVLQLNGRKYYGDTGALFG